MTRFSLHLLHKSPNDNPFVLAIQTRKPSSSHQLHSSCSHNALFLQTDSAHGWAITGIRSVPTASACHHSRKRNNALILPTTTATLDVIRVYRELHRRFWIGKSETVRVQANPTPIWALLMVLVGGGGFPGSGRKFLVLPAAPADGDVSEGATFGPVASTGLAEVTWLGKRVVVVVTELGVGGVASGAMDQGLVLVWFKSSVY
ncbi:hypothetical protein L2E82_27317 [Cichorium intybus]|uniref:Uncharacterized protein n=1 Tax=Cichorium intybus TaxID=13427 RepID=A0ACB9CSL6_CICIN|nr:hypothetical protein L2E82_27317 [Cichorium intybus]